MDERGWIPISLIASFNRVKQLTMDVQLVRDVLALSSLVQVRGNMVRMGGWERYVLPDAAPSKVEEQPLPHPYQQLTPYLYYEENVGYPMHYQQQGLGPQGGYQSHSPPSANGVGQQQQESAEAKIDSTAMNGDGHEEEDEEDDVVFVMGHEVGTWSPERRA